MLILTRAVDERIIIPLPDGRDLRIQVVQIRGDRVRIGVEAPPDVAVHREEIMQQIRAESVPA